MKPKTNQISTQPCALIDRSTSDGDWVLLQNCHLAKSWMPGLEKVVDALVLKTSSNHEKFRLFLTSMPVPSGTTLTALNIMCLILLSLT